VCNGYTEIDTMDLLALRDFILSECMGMGEGETWE
jgi:hypothetical protein